MRLHADRPVDKAGVQHQENSDRYPLKRKCREPPHLLRKTPHLISHLRRRPHHQLLHLLPRHSRKATGKAGTFKLLLQALLQYGTPHRDDNQDAHQAADRAGSAGTQGVLSGSAPRLQEQNQKIPPKARNQVQYKKPDAPEIPLHIVAQNCKGHHVAGDVLYSEMNEHGRKEPEPLPAAEHIRHIQCPELQRRPGVLASSEKHLRNKNSDVGRNQPPCHIWSVFCQ